jgi:hypothetical protein
MNDRERLEHGYRRLLACYPREFRRENEDEIIGVLLSTAADGQRRVGVAEAVDLIRGALRARLRLPRACPATVRAAVRLMYLGAVVELGIVVTVVVTEASVRSAILARYPGLTAAQWHAVVLAHLLPDEIVGPIAVCGWLWMAWAHRRGYYWARVVFAAMLGLETVSLLSALSEGAATFAPADLVAGAAAWIVHAVAVLLIFSKPSAAFFQPNPKARFFRVAGSQQ